MSATTGQQVCWIHHTFAACLSVDCLMPLGLRLLSVSCSFDAHGQNGTHACLHASSFVLSCSRPAVDKLSNHVMSSKAPNVFSP